MESSTADGPDASGQQTTTLRAFVQAQLMQLAMTARDERVRLGALERLDDQLGTVHARKREIDQAFVGAPALSLSLQQNVFSAEGLQSLAGVFSAMTGARPLLGDRD